MDLSYILTNTIIYGTLALVLQLFFAYHKFRNMLVGAVCMSIGYILAYRIHDGRSLKILWMIIIVMVLRWGTMLLVQRFSDDKKEWFWLLWTIWWTLMLGNMTNYIFWPVSVSLDHNGLSVSVIILLLLVINGLLWYVFRYTWIGKILTGMFEHQQLVKSLGVKTTTLLHSITAIGIVLLMMVAYIILTTNTIKVSDDMFYLIKGTGVMVLVGIANSKRIYVGTLLYVIAEYLLFITRGLPIAYKETLILVVILLVLFLKPEGLFSVRRRSV